MPQINPKDVKDSDLRGVEVIDNKLSLDERMAKRWKPSDTVRVRNFDDEAIVFQWMPDENEHMTLTDENIKIVHRDKPQLWRVEAGTEDIQSGACAYMMAKALYNQVAIKKTGVNPHPLDEREIKNFNLKSPEQQERFLDRFFIGRMSPAAMQRLAMESMEAKQDAKPKAKAKPAEESAPVS